MAPLAQAGNVEIVFAKLTARGDSSWNVAVTLKHGDTGWDHYANSWRIVDEQGKLLARRVLAHPHVDEQPFTRNIFYAKIPKDTKVVYIEATDKVHGLSPDRLRIDLDKSEGDRYKIMR
jgi:hypothetical protein